MSIVNDFLDFIAQNPSCYHTCVSFAELLKKEGYQELLDCEKWALVPGGKYFLRRNGTTLLAFRIPMQTPTGFMMTASHSDSPCFKIKDNAEKLSAHCVQLSTEIYGGPLMATWFDRPLSCAGRILVRTEKGLQTRLVNFDRDLLIIPSLAIHMNRAANDGVKLLANIDTVPLYGMEAAQGSFRTRLAQAAGVDAADILGTDLFLYVRGRGTVLGANNEFIASPRLDDLECAYGCMTGFLEADESAAIPVCCVFDNEEIGNSTKQGVGSSLMRDVLRRITMSLGMDEEDYLRLLSQSFLISADNAHAQHPNHPELADSLNCPRMNGGIVVKFNANFRYATDAVSCAVFRSVCEKAGVPVQVFANRSDMAAGGTLGGAASTRICVPTVDIGLAQLAMHSCYETAGAQDLQYLKDACKAFYSAALHTDGTDYTLA